MAAHESLQQLLGTTIFDLSGVRSGRLSDLLVDPSDGRVEYAQIALDSSGPGGLRYVVVPWSTVGIDREPVTASGCAERWFVRVRRETLERLARFEPAASAWQPGAAVASRPRR